jgi:hypothetical protein
MENREEGQAPVPADVGRHENHCDCGRLKVAGAIACSTCYAEARDRRRKATGEA